MAQDDTCTRYGFDIDILGASCADIYNKNPTSHDRSGYYVLKTDRLFFAYCDMELDCGGTKGGWMRIINLSNRDISPSGQSTYLSCCTGGSVVGCYSAHYSTDTTNALKKYVEKYWDIKSELAKSIHMLFRALSITICDQSLERLPSTHK